MTPFFSIITVCLNPGKKLSETLKSVWQQDFADYELVIKDGGSTDGSLTGIEQCKEKVRFICQKDSGIYDAMNQAVAKACGEYVFFLNCGDLLADPQVLSRMAEAIRTDRAEKKQEEHQIFYGNVFETLTGQTVISNPSLTAFGCYRNVPCHQACFYRRELLLQHPFQLQYRVRADYEQFLWCFFEGRANPQYVELTVTEYEGGGFSETKENLARSKREHRQIVKQYMTVWQRFLYRTVLLLTLAPLRTWLSRNERTAGFYNRIKSRCYHQ